MTITDKDMQDQLIIVLDGNDSSYDLDEIVKEFIEKFGIVTLDNIPGYHRASIEMRRNGREEG